MPRFDAFDDLKLAIDIGRYRLGREEGFAAPRVGGDPLQLQLGFDETRIVMVALAVMVKALC